MLKIFLRPAMIFIPLTLGLFIPEAHSLSWTIRWALIIMLYLVALQIKIADLKIQRVHIYLVLCNIALGVIPYLLIYYSGIGNRNLALAAFFIGITPTANAAPVVISFLHGKVEFVITAFVMTNFFVSLSLLLFIPLFTGQTNFDFVLDVGKNLAIVLGIPLIASYFTRLIYPTASKIPARCKTFTFSLWSYTLFILAAIARNHFITHPNEATQQVVFIGIISLILCIINFTIGYWIAPQTLRRESSQSLGQKNTTLTMYLALTLVNPLVAMGPIFYVLWHNSYNAYQMYKFEKNRNRRN